LFVRVLPGTWAVVPVIMCSGSYADCLKDCNSGWFREDLNFQSKYFKYQLSSPAEHVLESIPGLAERSSMCLSKEIVKDLAQDR